APGTISSSCRVARRSVRLGEGERLATGRKSPARSTSKRRYSPRGRCRCRVPPVSSLAPSDVRHLPLFRALSDAHIAELLSAFTPRTVEAGTVLFREGE